MFVQASGAGKRSTSAERTLTVNFDLGSPHGADKRARYTHVTSLTLSGIWISTPERRNMSYEPLSVLQGLISLLIAMSIGGSFVPRATGELTWN